MTTLNVNSREEITIHLLRVNELLEERIQILTNQLAAANQKIVEYEALSTAAPKLLKLGNTTTFLTN